MIISSIQPFVNISFFFFLSRMAPATFAVQNTAFWPLGLKIVFSSPTVAFTFPLMNEAKLKFSVFQFLGLLICTSPFKMVLMIIFDELNIILKILCFELFRSLIFRYVLFPIHRLKDSSPYGICIVRCNLEHIVIALAVSSLCAIFFFFKLARVCTLVPFLFLHYCLT